MSILYATCALCSRIKWLWNLKLENGYGFVKKRSYSIFLIDNLAGLVCHFLTHKFVLRSQEIIMCFYCI